jgi:RNA polymerase-associated protein CTR9
LLIDRPQSLFASLASDKANPLPYSRDIADQRRKYGESLLRKAHEHIALQEAHEAEVKERLNVARQKRQEEKDRTETLEVSHARLWKD